MDNPLIAAYQDKSLSHATLLIASAEQASRFYVELAAFLNLDPADCLAYEPSESLKVSDAKRIRQFASMSRSMSPIKIIFIPSAEAITHEAANALLKTLEEPSPKTAFILATNRLENILPTIRSRCQVRRIFESDTPPLIGQPLESQSLVGYFNLSKILAGSDDPLEQYFHSWLRQSSGNTEARQTAVQALILSYLTYLPSNPNRRLLLDNFFLELYTMNHKEAR